MEIAILIILCGVMCIAVFVSGLIYNIKHPKKAKNSHAKSFEEELKELGWY